MRYPEPLAVGRLIRRYKRFLAEVETERGERLTVHCPNTGAMLGCSAPGSEVWYSRSARAARKFPHTLEVVVTAAGRVGVNTAAANRLVAEALASRALEGGPLAVEPGAAVDAEAAIPGERGRFDFLIRERDEVRHYLEVKSVTLCDETGVGAFPDAVSERALRHVDALARRVAAGDRASLFFCVQHTGVRVVTPADAIHPAYGRALRAAQRAGVTVCAYGVAIERDEVRLDKPLPVRL